jgi:putative membrane protein insertion efficiency factor
MTPGIARRPGGIGRALALGAIRAYQLTLSSLVGRQCRHLPSCSEYTAEAITRHGVWPGAWMGAARICRCGPFGTSGLDLVCETIPERASWHAPWRYGRWRGTNGQV